MIYCVLCCITEKALLGNQRRLRFVSGAAHVDSDTNPQTNPTWKTRDPEPIDRIKLGFVVIAVVAALVLGASTQLPPWRILFVESLAGFALLIAMLRCSGLALRRIVWIIAALLILLPAIELVPLPATLWRIAPISDLWPPSPDGSFWRPLSLDADRTLQSLFAMQACVAIFLAVALLNSAERLVVIRAILLVAIASSLLGVLQMQAPTRGLYLLADAVPGTLTGFFGNRNHQGDFLVIAAGLATLFIRPGRPHLENGIAILLAAVLAATALATQSRSAMLLLGFTAFALAIVRFRARSSLIPIVLVLLCGLAALSSFNSVISTSFARFEGAGGKLDRATIWSQTKVAVDQTLPWGSGMGTFRPLYESVEPLALVSPTFVNHAHNDLLQLVAETGIPGLVVLLVVLAAIGLRARAVLADRGDVIGQTALVCLCVPLLHSLVDYPLRTLAIGSIAAVLMALLFAPVPQDARQPAPTTLFGSRRLLACLPVLILLAICLAMNLALTLYAAGRPALLVGIAPFSGDVRLSLASELVRRPERVDEAAVEAFAALNRNAFSSQALAIIGTARLLQNQQPEADAAFLSADRKSVV